MEGGGAERHVFGRFAVMTAGVGAVPHVHGAPRVRHALSRHAHQPGLARRLRLRPRGRSCSLPQEASPSGFTKQRLLPVLLSCTATASRTASKSSLPCRPGFCRGLHAVRTGYAGR